MKYYVTTEEIVCEFDRLMGPFSKLALVCKRIVVSVARVQIRFFLHLYNYRVIT